MNPATGDYQDSPNSVSVVVPVYNGRLYLERCLRAIESSTFPIREILIVDDASTDNAAQEAEHSFQIPVIRLDGQCGAAFARNWGVHHSSGDVVFFVDADVEICPDTIAIGMDALSRDPDIAAVFGSYDNRPAHPSFLSQYRNLMHHWVHQHSSEEASTFWTGCGAVRRNIFASLGGFDPQSLAIEDIEFGARMKLAGHRIRLLKHMTCKHLKVWRFFNILRTDLWGRGVPWVSLIIRNRTPVNDLNVNTATRWATTVTGGLLLSLVGLPLAGYWTALIPWATFMAACSAGALLVRPRSAWRQALAAVLVVAATSVTLVVIGDLRATIPIALVLLVLAIQWPFFRFLARVRGIAFALAAIPMKILFFAICGLSVPLGFLHSKFDILRTNAKVGNFPRNADSLFSHERSPL